MINLYELMLQAQGGEAMRNMARQFGLSSEQLQAAMTAMLPAFARGFERRAARPDVFSGFLDQMTKGPFSAFFEDTAAAFGLQARDRGNDVLEQIFGSKEVSRALAAQTEAMTGISQQVLKQMLPMMASIMAGGIAQEAKAPSWQDQFDNVMQQMAGMMPGMAPPEKAPDPVKAGMQQWGRMFEAGIDAQRSQLKAFDDMLDQVFGPGTRPDTKNEDQ